MTRGIKTPLAIERANVCNSAWNRLTGWTGFYPRPATNRYPNAIDELPVLVVAACFAHGTTVIRDAAELRMKETDRITAMVQELRNMGAVIQELPDGIVVEGSGSLKGTTCQSYGDHRVAMALAIAGLLAEGETVIEGAECVSVSYPEFWEHLETMTKRDVLAE
ncbi:MAG: hypothetical protein IIC27_04805 [Chloroflexi bacterium]|nr:hypothetical protein [Chloroflexota bacterium]